MRASTLAIMCLLVSILSATTVTAQGNRGSSLVGQAGIESNAAGGLFFNLDGPNRRLNLIANSTRVLTLQHRFKRVHVDNPQVISATPLSGNTLQVAGLRPGITRLSIVDERDQIRTITIVVQADAEQLRMVLEEHFPTASLAVSPLPNGVILTGTVDQPNMITQIDEVTRSFFPTVFNHITVAGVQQVKLDVKIVEVSRTKFRSLGVDSSLPGSELILPGGFVEFNADPLAVTSPLPIFATAPTLGVAGSSFAVRIEALRTLGVAKILSEPTLTTVSGRPARIVSGGEIPFEQAAGLGATSIQFKPYGTIVDFVPIVQDTGKIRLEVRAEVSEPDYSQAINDNPPLITRSVDTAADLMSGQTMVVAGLLQTSIDTTNSGVPWISDVPWIGALFRRVSSEENERELLIMVTVELVAPLDPHEVPPCGPGQTTEAPNDVELYWRGYLEVPRCCNDGSCAECQGGAAPVITPDSANIPSRRLSPRSTVIPTSATRPVTRRPVVGQPVSPSVPSARRFTQNRRNITPQTARSTTKRLPPSSQTGLIGPIGYDVIK